MRKGVTRATSDSSVPRCVAVNTTQSAILLQGRVGVSRDGPDNSVIKHVRMVSTALIAREFVRIVGMTGHVTRLLVLVYVLPVIQVSIVIPR